MIIPKKLANTKIIALVVILAATLSGSVYMIYKIYATMKVPPRNQQAIEKMPEMNQLYTKDAPASNAVSVTMSTSSQPQALADVPTKPSDNSMIFSDPKWVNLTKNDYNAFYQKQKPKIGRPDPFQYENNK